MAGIRDIPDLADIGRLQRGEDLVAPIRRRGPAFAQHSCPPRPWRSGPYHAGIGSPLRLRRLTRRSAAVQLEAGRTQPRRPERVDRLFPGTELLVREAITAARLFQ